MYISSKKKRECAPDTLGEFASAAKFFISFLRFRRNAVITRRICIEVLRLKLKFSENMSRNDWIATLLLASGPVDNYQDARNHTGNDEFCLSCPFPWDKLQHYAGVWPSYGQCRDLLLQWLAYKTSLKMEPANLKPLKLAQDLIEN